MSEALIEAVALLSPRTLERARRLTCAVELLRAGKSRREACVIIQGRFFVCQSSAWRLVDIAADVAGPPQVQKEATP
jgi:hypothetical protein